MSTIRNFFSVDNALFPVIGMLAAAATAKLGYGQWAAGGIAFFIAAKVAAAITAILTARLNVWVAQLEKQQQHALVRIRARALRL